MGHRLSAGALSVEQRAVVPGPARSMKEAPTRSARRWPSSRQLVAELAMLTVRVAVWTLMAVVASLNMGGTVGLASLVIWSLFPGHSSGPFIDPGTGT